MNRTSIAIEPGAGAVLGLAAVLGIVGMGFYVYAKRAEIARGINPTSDQNVAYKAANAVVRAVTGDPETSVGSKIYDWLHADSDIEAPVTQADIDAYRALNGRAAGANPTATTVPDQSVAPTSFDYFAP